MSRWGISGAPIPGTLPFAHEITLACAAKNFPPCFAYAIKGNETAESTDAALIQYGHVGDLMPDGSNAGHGIFQLTDSWPSNWADPLANTLYAIDRFLQPAIDFWTAHKFGGESLVKAVAASFNAGTMTAWDYHVRFSDVDGVPPRSTTDKYGARVLAKYLALIEGKPLVFP